MSGEERNVGDKLAERVEDGISEIKAAYLQGLKDAVGQEAVGPEAIRFAAVVLSAVGAQLKRDPDCGVVIGLPNDQFVDDRFAVESFKRFLRELKKMDPQAAEDLRWGRPMEWSGDGDDEQDLGILEGPAYERDVYPDVDGDMGGEVG